MWNKKHSPRLALRPCALLLLAMLITSSLTPSAVAGHQPEHVRVLIAFAGPPGAAEQALVRRAGGQVRYTYGIVNAIAAGMPEAAIEGISRHRGVLRVEPDLMMRALDQELDNAWGVTRIGAGEVHAAPTAPNTGTGIRIAIIDSGIDFTHPGLDDNYAGGFNFINPNDNPYDVYGHGTHVAGTACAEDNDNGDPLGPYGVVGVAPACDLYSLRVLDDNGYGYASDLIGALDWAVANSIQVANLSLGWDRDPGQTVEQAFIAAEEADIVIVAAACNNGNPPGKGENVCWPSKYSSVIAVAATDANDRRATFSSTGTEVELAAPGVSVLSTWNGDTSYANPQPVCREEEERTACYKYGSGTSMASPHVAGTAALILAAGIEDANGNGRVNDEVRRLLIETSEDLGTEGWDPHYGYGLVRADWAVAAIGGTEPTDSPPTVDIVNPAQGATVAGTVTIQVAADDAEDAAGSLAVEIAIDGNSAQASYSADSDRYELTWNTATYSDGGHTISASATDSGNHVSTAAPVTVTVNNSSPEESVHIGDLDGAAVSYGNTWAAIVTLEVHDSHHSPVVGAVVVGDWGSGGSGSGACTTNDSGTCTVVSDAVHKRYSSVTFTVDNLTVAGYIYDPAANHDPDGDSTGSAIVISKP